MTGKEIKVKALITKAKIITYKRRNPKVKLLQALENRLLKSIGEVNSNEKNTKY